ncbi:MAG: winged helix-turn-helix transcriptional regulator [Lentisphaeria bacterium]|nr:winged helix-turn-helix transcriptional regulator [Lentisphaeria bacterium]
MHERSDSEVAGAGLKPTLWRTCRALANRRRLGIVCHLIDHPDDMVSQVARGVGIPVAVASQYLRILNARGVLRATRRSRWVHYRLAADPSLPEASVLVAALGESLAADTRDLDSAMATLTAFTHPRRLLLLALLWQYGHLDYSELMGRSGIPHQALTRHLDKLQRRGLVDLHGGRYRLTCGPDVLARALLSIAVRE